MNESPIKAIVLAGERPGGNALARAHGLAAGVLVDVAGQACITRVINTLRNSSTISGGLIAGPVRDVCDTQPLLGELFSADDFRWCPPADGPSASALAASRSLSTFPQLITAADHALLTPAIVDGFVGAALRQQADVIVGLVPYPIVRAAYPQSRRTRLRFRDGEYCGANLFLLRTTRGQAALTFWQALEANRKKPWRMAGQLGPATLLRYVLGRLSLHSALALLSQRAGASVAVIEIGEARAAVDVDSTDDLALATWILEHDA